MVSVVRPVATSGDAVDDAARWLAQLDQSFSAPEKAAIRAALDFIEPLYRARTLPPTGEPLLAHALGAASVSAQLRTDSEALIATLLFAVPDLLESASEQLAERFGPGIAALLDGITRVRKIQELHYMDLHLLQPEERHQQAESLRKMLLAMVADIRAVLVKLAWRTQTMHYLSQCPADIAREVARETLEVYAPLANRLGVWQIKWELEDLAFRYIEPQLYKKIARLLDEKRVDRERFIADVIDAIRQELEKAEVRAEVTGQPETHLQHLPENAEKAPRFFRGLRCACDSCAGGRLQGLLHGAGHRPQPLAADSR